jgi:hypothetical protein
MDDAEHGAAGGHEADHHREAITAANEVFRAVDRIDEPQSRRRENPFDELGLFADNQIMGKARRDARDDVIACRLVGHGDRRVI